MFRTIRRKVFRFALISGAGAAASYFFDRERGPERREQARAKADTLLKPGGPTPAWKPERAANAFDTPVTTPVPATDPVPAPTIADVIATPEREVDPLASRP